MIDKLRMQATPRNAPDFRIDIRPDPESNLELKIRTGLYPAGIVGGAQAPDQAFRAVLSGSPLSMNGRLESKVTLTRTGDLVLIEFSGPNINHAGGLELDAKDYGELIEHAIASRTGPRTVYI